MSTESKQLKDGFGRNVVSPERHLDKTFTEQLAPIESFVINRIRFKLGDLVSVTRMRCVQVGTKFERFQETFVGTIKTISHTGIVWVLVSDKDERAVFKDEIFKV